MSTPEPHVLTEACSDRPPHDPSLGRALHARQFASHTRPRLAPQPPNHPSAQRGGF
jgi:hypothetical protein